MQTEGKKYSDAFEKSNRPSRDWAIIRSVTTFSTTSPPEEMIQLFQTLHVDAPLLYFFTVTSRADNFLFKEIGDDVLVNINTEDGYLVGRCCVDQGHHSFKSNENMQLVVLGETFFPLANNRNTVLEYESEKNEILAFHDGQMEYCIFLLVEQEGRISYRRVRDRV